MQITIDTNNLSEMDVAMLAFLAGQGSTDETDAAEIEPVVEETPAPAKKAPAKKAAPKPEPVVEAEAEVEDDLLGDAPTMADAVAAATKLVSSGGAAKVKEALAEVGAKRVSEMDEASIPAFLAALQA